MPDDPVDDDSPVGNVVDDSLSVSLDIVVMEVTGSLDCFDDAVCVDVKSSVCVAAL